jgi:hypothetical protein
MSEVNFGKTITLKQASNLIRTNADTVFLLEVNPELVRVPYWRVLLTD